MKYPHTFTVEESDLLRAQIMYRAVCVTCEWRGPWTGARSQAMTDGYAHQREKGG